jgi:alkylation response protein AidB-like acyl-CoA dehydrogenase
MASAAGYSGTPLPRKLGIKAGNRVAFLDAPPEFAQALGELPEDVAPRTVARGPLDVIVAFFDRRAALERRLPALIRALDPEGALWIAWPKRASGVPTDVTENVVRELGLAAGVVDVKVAAIDATWSGLKLVIRLRDRPRR